VRRGRALVAGAFGAVAGAVVLTAGDVGCERFRFDAARWAGGGDDPGFGTTTARERMTATMLRCGTLDGRTHAQVRAMLGEGGRLGGGGGETWTIGTSGDGIGFGHPNVLEVFYGRDDRVVSAGLLGGDD
jgi:hypothetical protein